MLYATKNSRSIYNSSVSQPKSSLRKIPFPLLGDAGFLSASGNTVQIDIHDIKRPLLEMAELWVFPIAVLIAALHEYISDLTEEDEGNIRKHVYSCGDSVLQTLQQMAKDETLIISGRIRDYYTACQEEMVCGYSSYGKGNLLFQNFEDFEMCARDKIHEAKCAFLFGYFLYYFDYFGTPATLADIPKLKRSL